MVVMMVHTYNCGSNSRKLELRAVKSNNYTYFNHVVKWKLFWHIHSVRTKCASSHQRKCEIFFPTYLRLILRFVPFFWAIFIALAKCCLSGFRYKAIMSRKYDMHLSSYVTRCAPSKPQLTERNSRIAFHTFIIIFFALCCPLTWHFWNAIGRDGKVWKWHEFIESFNEQGFSCRNLEKKKKKKIVVNHRGNTINSIQFGLAAALKFNLIKSDRFSLFRCDQLTCVLRCTDL